MANLPSSFAIRVASRVTCPSIITRERSPCTNAVKFETFPSFAAYWVAEPVPKTPKSLSLYYIKAVGLGAKCPNGTIERLISVHSLLLVNLPAALLSFLPLSIHWASKEVCDQWDLYRSDALWPHQSLS